MFSAIIVPMLNPNENDALVVEVNVNTGQLVQQGEVICTLETTKSTADLEAPQAGYIHGLQYHAGETARSGEIFCYISDDPGWHPPPDDLAARSISKPSIEATSQPANLRITQPALRLAMELGLDLNRLPVDQLLTENLVRILAENPSLSGKRPSQAADIDPSALVIYGAGGHGKSVIEMIRALDSYEIAGVIDDDPQVRGIISGIKILGGAEALPDLWARGIRQAANAVGGIGNIDIRRKVFRRLSQAGFTCPSLIHPTAVIEASADLDEGIQILPLAYVGSEARIGYGSIINTGAIVSHDCTVGEYSNIAPGAILAGGVQIGANVLVGMGVTVNLLVNIGAHARLGNGSTIKTDVPEHGIVRAGTIWPS